MHQLIDKKKIIFFYIILFIFLNTQIANNQNFAKESLIKVKKIEVFGLSKKNNSKVSESLSSLLSQNIFFVKKNYLNKILNQNSLIEYFNIKKIYPDVIKVYIKKAEFLAITNKNNKRYFIGSNGKLTPVGEFKNFNKKLPYVFTKNKYKNFVNLKKIIDKSKFEFKEIEVFYYFPSNRWDIKTKKGLLIKLPEKNVFQSLELAYLINNNEEFNKNKIIDLRKSNYIVTSNE